MFNQKGHLAMKIFRDRYGVAADPEKLPVCWQYALHLAEEQLAELPDEGGEA